MVDGPLVMLNVCPTLRWKDKSFRPRSLNTIRAGNQPDVRAVLVMVGENDEGAARNLSIPWIPQSQNGPRVRAVLVEPVYWS